MRRLRPSILTLEIVGEGFLLGVVVVGDGKVAVLVLGGGCCCGRYEPRIGGGLPRAAVVQAPRLRRRQQQRSLDDQGGNSIDKQPSQNPKFNCTRGQKS